MTEKTGSHHSASPPRGGDALLPRGSPAPLSGGADYTSFAQREKVLPRIEVRRKLGIAVTPSGEN